MTLKRKGPLIAVPKAKLPLMEAYSKNVDPGVQLSQAAPALLDYYGVVSTVLGGCCA